MKESSVEVILKALEGGAQLSLDLSTIFFRTRYKGVLLMKKPLKIDGNWAEKYKLSQTFYTRLNQLKRDGLIEKRKTDSGSLWEITSQGKKWINENTKNCQPKRIAGPKTTIIISYDVPEKYASARRRLREILKLMDFSAVHKSVWVGEGPISEDLFDWLREQKLIDDVHIFEVGKRGTLVRITNK